MRDVRHLYVSLPRAMSSVSTVRGDTRDIGVSVRIREMEREREHYAVWDGSAHEEEGVILMNRDYLEMNGMEEGAYVHVEVMQYEPSVGGRVVMASEDAGEYEAICRNREAIERSMLNTTSVVCVGTCIPVYVGPSETYRLRVEGVGGGQVCRLSVDTEIVVVERGGEEKKREYYIVRRLVGECEGMMKYNGVMMVSGVTAKRIWGEYGEMGREEYMVCEVRDVVDRSERVGVVGVVEGVADGVVYTWGGKEGVVEFRGGKREKGTGGGGEYPFEYEEMEEVRRMVCGFVREGVERGGRWMVVKGAAERRVKVCDEFDVHMDGLKAGGKRYGDVMVVDMGEMMGKEWMEGVDERRERWEEVLGKELGDVEGVLCVKTASRQESEMVFGALKERELVKRGKDVYLVDIGEILGAKKRSVREGMREAGIEMLKRPASTRLTVMFIDFHMIHKEEVTNEEEKKTYFYLKHEVRKMVDTAKKYFKDTSFVYDQQVPFEDKVSFVEFKQKTIDVSGLREKVVDVFVEKCMADKMDMVHIVDRMGMLDMAHVWNTMHRGMRTGAGESVRKYLEGVEKKNQAVGGGGRFEEVVGMESVKEAVRNTIQNRIRYEQLYRELPIKISTSRIS